MMMPSRRLRMRPFTQQMMRLEMDDMTAIIIALGTVLVYTVSLIIGTLFMVLMLWAWLKIE
ncbi:MAG: hypothetical protein ACR2N8_01195 [Parvibaculales bacterium]